METVPNLLKATVLFFLLPQIFYLTYPAFERFMTTLYIFHVVYVSVLTLVMFQTWHVFLVGGWGGALRVRFLDHPEEGTVLPQKLIKEALRQGKSRT